MANAIKKISVQRGHDVTEYTLVCFGGAAGQHACLVADALGMQTVYIHPLAGVLSAYGIGLADVTAMKQQAVEAELSDATLASLRAPFASLESSATRSVASAGRRRQPDSDRAQAGDQIRRHGQHVADVAATTDRLGSHWRRAFTKSIGCDTAS